MPIPRSMRSSFLEVKDYRARKYFQKMVDFLSVPGIDSRLSELEREMKTEKGVYLTYWVESKNAWWLGFQEIQRVLAKKGSLRGNITSSMERTLSTATKLFLLINTMPLFKQEEIRSRILGDEFLEPVLFEIDTASNLWSIGYDIGWLQPSNVEGERMPEFIACRPPHEFEVECKSKNVDAGRKIERRYFYRLVDALSNQIAAENLTGHILITVPNRIPRTGSWRNQLAREMSYALRPGNQTLAMDDGTELDISLSFDSGKEYSIKALEHKVGALQQSHSFFAVAASKRGTKFIDPIIVRLSSKGKDRFLEDVLDDLREANEQFTGTKGGLICCLLPEVESFEGLQENSALKAMTAKYFDRYAPSYVNVVSYTSEGIRTITGQVISAGKPYLNFWNNNYDASYGPSIPEFMSPRQRKA